MAEKGNAVDHDEIPSSCGGDDGCFNDASAEEHLQSSAARFNMQEGKDEHGHPYAVRRMLIGGAILRLYAARGAAVLDVTTPHDGAGYLAAPRVWLLMGEASRDVPRAACHSRPPQWVPPCQTPTEFTASRASRCWFGGGSPGSAFPVIEVAGVTAGAWISCRGLSVQTLTDDVGGHPHAAVLATSPAGTVPMRIFLNGHIVHDDIPLEPGEVVVSRYRYVPPAPGRGNVRTGRIKAQATRPSGSPHSP